MKARLDALVIGAGPNGLAAALTIAEQGFAVHVIEAAAEAGGACRTVELTGPGFHNDVGAAVLPFAGMSRFFRDFDVGAHGVELLHSSAPVAHPLEDDDAVLLERSVDETACGLGVDAARYRRAMGPLAGHAEQLLDQFMGPPRPPRNPLLMAAFGLPALLPATMLTRAWLQGSRGRALVAGLAAHSTASLRAPATASAGLVMAMTAHAAGWPIVAGGSGRLTAALVARLTALGGTLETGRRVDSLRELPPARVRVLDLAPRHVERVCADELPGRYRRRLRTRPHGPGVFKLDWALDGPIPWADPRCSRAATVHVGGTLEEITASEAAVAAGRHAARPFVLLVQPSLFDPSRAPAWRHTAWAYCHVPNGSPVDMTGRIEAQVERFAPGFRDLIAARHVMDSAALETFDANLVGGDVNGGKFGLVQLFLSPAAHVPPHRTPNPSIVICSSATPPGGGVHGMCGWRAAQAVLRTLRTPARA